MAIQGPKDFYSIQDFYNSLKNPEYVPSLHRHFQVYLHPIFYQYADVIPIAYRRGNTHKMQKNYAYGQLDNNNTNFFEDWFKGNTHEQFSLAIQSITLPTQVDVSTQDFESPLGHYNAVTNDDYYGKVNSTQLTFQLIDQLSPFIEKKINDWVFEVQRCYGFNSKGTYSTNVTPKVNIIIKYFKQTEVYPGKKVTPNFIYYFTQAFPNQFTTCSINHGNSDDDNGLTRTVTFKFNQFYIFQNQAFADKYGLGYLFNQITI